MPPGACVPCRGTGLVYPFSAGKTINRQVACAACKGTGKQ